MDPPKDNPTTINKPPKDKMIMNEDDLAAITHSFERMQIRKVPSIFSFEVKPASKLKLAIAALSDSDFNPKGLGMVYVDQHDFNIRVHNAESGAMCLLRLKATGLMNFKCCEVVKGKMVRLEEISHNLSVVDEEDTVSVYHLGGSTALSFKFGNSSPCCFSVELLPKDAEEDYPFVNYICEATVPTTSLRLLIEEFQKQGKLPVSADITDSSISFAVGKKTVYANTFFGISQGNIKGMIPGDRHYASFCLTHDKSLEKASFLVPEYVISFLVEPVYKIMLSFEDGELLNLMYIIEAIEMYSNCPAESGQESLWLYYKPEPWD